jgi:hypothetical protein
MLAYKARRVSSASSKSVAGTSAAFCSRRSARRVALQQVVVLEPPPGLVEVAEVVQRLGLRARVGHFLEGALVGIDADERGRRVGGLAVDAEPQPLPAEQVPVVVVVEDVEDDVPRRRPLFFALQAQVGQVDGVAADAVVADPLAEVGGQGLLPGLAVADLLAAGEAVAVGVDAAGLLGVVNGPAGAQAVVAVRVDRAVEPFLEIAVDVQVARLRVILRERERPAFQPGGQVLLEVEESAQLLALAVLQALLLGRRPVGPRGTRQRGPHSSRPVLQPVPPGQSVPCHANASRKRARARRLSPAGNASSPTVPL